LCLAPIIKKDDTRNCRLIRRDDGRGGKFSKREGKMPVYYKCKNCDEEHPSPIAFGDKASFDTATLKNNSFQCPKTNQSALYSKEDMFWKD